MSDAEALHAQASKIDRPWEEVIATALPLFDQQYYSIQSGKEYKSKREALEEYIALGWTMGLRAHPLFHESFYLATNPDVGAAGFVPLIHYAIWGEREGRRAHPRLSPTKRPSSHSPTPWGPLSRHLALPPSARPDLSYFFSARWYKSLLPDVDWKTTDPLVHYIGIGAAQGLSPFPSMDPTYYAQMYMADTETEPMTVLEHYEHEKAEPRPPTFGLFSTQIYLMKNQDLGRICASSHFAKFGAWEDRAYGPLQVNKYFYDRFSDRSFAATPPIGRYLLSDPGKRSRVLFVGHEGSRTGAPGILLKLVQQFSAFENAECVSIIDQPGPMFEEHERVSLAFAPEVHRLSVYNGRASLAQFDDSLDEMMAQLDDNPPMAVIVNSAESRIYADYFARRGIPVIMLMHEIATLYPEAEIRKMEADCDLVVLPAEFVASALRKVIPKPKNAVVISQGLLRDTFGLRARGDREAVFRSYGSVSDEDILVVGCGTLDGRKGFDLFIETARQVRARAPGLRIRFAWVGGRKNWKIRDGAVWDSIGYWSHWDIMASELTDDLLVVSEVPDTEAFLVNSDIFLLTSRADPFPCVVHEAMASRLPVVAFDNAGGAPEAFLPVDAGVTVPYHDTNAMADAVIGLARDPKRRAAMGERGRERVLTDYRFEDYTRRLAVETLKLAGLPQTGLGALELRRSSRGRIYFTAPLWTVSGVNTMTEFLVNDLNAQGFEAEIVLTTGRFGPPRDPSPIFYDVKVQEFLPNAPMRMLQPGSLDSSDHEREIISFLSRNAPCILVPGFDYAASEAARRLPSTVGVVGVAHADDREHYDHAYRLGHLWNRVVAVSDHIRQGLMRVNPSLDDRTAVIPYGLPAAERADLTPFVAVKRKSSNPIRLVYAGRFEVFQKRIMDYVKLARALADADVPYELTMIGEGGKEADVAASLEREISAGRVVLTGRLGNRETLERFRPAHVVLVLSDFEGLPLSLIEGFQRGCIPVVYDMKSGIPEVIEDGVNGFVVPRGDIAAVVDRVQRLRDDPELRSRMMDAALATPERKGLTLRHMGDAYGRLFAEVFEELSEGDRQRRAVLQMLNA